MGGAGNANAVAVVAGWLMATYRLDPEAAHQALLGSATERHRRTLDVAQDILSSHAFQCPLGRFIRASTRDPGVQAGER